MNHQTKNTFMPLRHALLLAASLGLSACASLSEGECRVGDWYGVGVEDGERGYPLSRLASHREACGEYGIGVQADAWREGRERGLLRYCTPENGARVGRAGESYQQVCPVELEAAFLREFEWGHRLWDLEQQISQMESRISSLDAELDKKDLADDKRKRLERERRDLRDELKDLKRDLRHFELMRMVH